MPDAAQDRSGIENRSTLIFESGALSLCDIAGCLVLRDGPREIRISSTPFEPCTYLEGTSCRTILHNAFAESDIRRIAARGGTLRSITGTEYDAGRLCGLLAFAAAHLAECDIGYAEGRMAIEQLKGMGALGPERAVELAELGLRSISTALSHSRRRSERIMYTPDGRVYVRAQR